MKRLFLPLGVLTLVAFGWSHFGQNPTDDKPNDYTNWSEYLGGPDRNHYSNLTQITPDNVGQLKVAWRYSTADSGQIQTNPIIVDGVLYGLTPTNQVFALDAATGQEKWRSAEVNAGSLNTNRGVTYWQDGNDKRILFAAAGYLRAVDAQTGQSVTTFGQNGRVSLKAGLGETAADKFVISNTPGTLFGDLLIMPLRLSEGADAAPGYIQAFNVRTGKLAWVFHTIPHPGEYGYETWPKDAYLNTYLGGANNWAGMAIDRPRGIVYVPTGSAAFDFYGGNRKGQNLFANCLIALDARTGKRLWHFQAVHHDVWDRDFPAPPNLLTVTQNGPDGRPRRIDAVAQVTKAGYVYVFDRVTGKPLFPIHETPYPKSDLADEETWPTQPLPSKPAPYARQTITENDLNPYSENRDSLLATFRKARKGVFMPLGQQPTLVYPGLDGGAEWGGAAADPANGLLYVNANEMAWLLSLRETPRDDQLAHLSAGQRLYTQNCLVCHGPERKGNPASGYPSLVDIGQRRPRAYVHKLISNGKGMMPGFASLTEKDKQLLMGFLFGDEKQEAGSSDSSPKRPYVRYSFNGYTKFLDSKGQPGIRPPWGTLTAIDLNTGEHRWQVPLGEDPQLKAKGIRNTGTENYGGPVVTASGLLFIAATKDEMFRAFDKTTGRLLWETKLPAAGHATPATYQVGGKQYVVIACGGGKLGTRKGNQYVAFALP